MSTLTTPSNDTETAMADGNTRLEIERGVATITFDRPDSSANIFDEATLDELNAHIEQLEKEKHVKSVFITSAKNGIFIAGADINTLSTASEEEVARGRLLFQQTCAVCHGQNAIGGVADLRHMTADTHGKFNQIVLGGLYLEKGMASFSDILSEEETNAIHAYVIARANEDWGR